MRKVVYCLFAGLIVLAYMMGRLHEQQKGVKDYQAACVLSDICHYMMDNIGTDAEEIYFGVIDNLDCYSSMRITKEDMEEYYWNYKQ